MDTWTSNAYPGSENPPAGRGAARPPAVPRRKHPAQGARVVALASSVAATIGIGAALAHAGQSDVPSSSEVSTGVVAGSAGAAASAAATSTTTASAKTSTTSRSATTSASAAAYADGTYDGTAEPTRWGDVQVEVTIKSGHIVSVAELQAPNEGRSVSINTRAAPILESEVIAAQSSHISAVSGATYTSETYRTSLQAALDQAASTTTG